MEQKMKTVVMNRGRVLPGVGILDTGNEYPLAAELADQLVKAGHARWPYNAGQKARTSKAADSGTEKEG